MKIIYTIVFTAFAACSISFNAAASEKDIDVFYWMDAGPSFTDEHIGINIGAHRSTENIDIAVHSSYLTYYDSHSDSDIETYPNSDFGEVSLVLSYRWQHNKLLALAGTGLSYNYIKTERSIARRESRFNPEYNELVDDEEFTTGIPVIVSAQYAISRYFAVGWRIKANFNDIDNYYHAGLSVSIGRLRN